MAQIPDALPLAPLEGETTPAIAPAATDFGLGQAGQTAESVAMMSRRTSMLQLRAQAAADRSAAVTSPQFQDFGEQDARGFAADAGAWNGRPGFASDQIAKVKDRLTAASAAYAASGATPGQVGEFQSQGMAIAARRGSEANQFEQSRLMQQADDVQATAINGAKTQMIAAFAPVRQQLIDGYDGSSPTLAPQMQQGFDAAVAPIIAAAPEALKPRLQLEASVMREQATAEAGELQGHAQSAYVITGATKQADALVNTVSSNPLAYDSVAAQLPAIAATLPADVRAKTLQEWQGSAAEARVEGLIAARKPAQALAELNDGRYDAALAPDKKTELEDRATAENRAYGPDAIARGAAAWNTQQAMDADLNSRTTTGRSVLNPQQVNADVAAGIISGEDAGKYFAAAQQADRNFAQAGPVNAMTNAELAAAAAAPPPDPADVPATMAYRARKQAIATAQDERKEPGQWAFSSTTQQLGGQPMGAALQGQWQAALQAQGPDRNARMAAYAGTMLGVQHQAGILPGQMQILPQAAVAQIAAGVTSATPEGKLAALQGVAGLVGALPARVEAPDGATVNPRAIFGGQLAKAGLTPVESSTIADFGAYPVKLAHVVAALNDSALKTPLPGAGATARLARYVRDDLKPFLATTDADADGPAMAEARVQRTILVAREFMQSKGMSDASASAAAAADAAGGYRYVDGWRMPLQAANSPATVAIGTAGTTQRDGLAAARQGAAQILSQLSANGGAGFYGPSTIAGDLKTRQMVHVSQIAQSGGWKTLPDDSGLALGVPQPDGLWHATYDTWGRPVQATWSQLQGAAAGQASPFAAPPANPVTTPKGQPVPAFGRSAGFSALSASVEQQESGGVNGLVSPKGALGVMQLMPDTGARYARQIGLAWDPQRALNDPAYNRKIGEAALGDLTSRYMTGANPAAGIGLAAAAYNAGEGRLTGYTDPKSGKYVPGWLQTIGDPRTGRISLQAFVDRIPFPETRKYVGQVLGRATQALHGDVG